MKTLQKQEEIKKILLTGGHAGTTAIAIVEELISSEKNWDIYWIGPRNAISGKKVNSWEEEVFPKYNVKFNAIIAGKLQKKWTIHTLTWIAKIPIGFIHAIYLLIKIRPKVVLSFGGYSALPVVIVSKFLGIPVIVHEQTSVVGLANRLSIPFVKKIALSRASSFKYVPKHKSVLTGNPLMKSIIDVSMKESLGKPPTIYVTGGSRGSQTINSCVEKILPILLKKYFVIHTSGNLDYQKFVDIKSRLDKTLSNNYEVYSFVDPMEIDNLYRQADLVIGRSGANTVSEIMYTKRPTIFIPHPAIMYDEQYKNALIAKDYGVAKIVKQDDLSADKLLIEIENLFKNWNKIVTNLKNSKSPDEKASASLAKLLLEEIN